MEEKKGGPNIKYVIIGLLFTLLMVGLYDYVWNTDLNKCEMTFMWQNPEYIPVKLPRAVASAFPRYGVYSYGEGALAALLSAGQYTGQPVLFVPGNGGSYKQVRSLASVAYRKSLDDDESRSFDFFTLDLAEDLGALYGPALEEQTEFMVAVVPLIQQLYPSAKPVIIVGHSMGGLVARAALISPSLQGGVVPLIVTLATPHVAPPLPLDANIYDFYAKVKSYWSPERLSTGSLSTVALVSVGGGRNDAQVNALAIVAPGAHVTVLSTAVPGCWATTDHQSIVWCKQLVLAIVRALYDSVDRNTLLPHTNTNRLTAVFHYHLVAKHSGNHYVSQRHRQQMKLSAGATWTEISSRQLNHSQPAQSAHTYIMLPLTGQPKSKYHQATVTLRAAGDSYEWIFACAAIEAKSGEKTCKSGMNLSRGSRLVGGRGGRLVTVLLRPLVEEGYTHLVISVLKQETKAVASWDVHGETDRLVTVAAPRLVRSFTPTVALQHTPSRGILQDIVLEGLNEAWHSYEVLVTPSSSCPNTGSKHPQLWLTAHTSDTLALAHSWLDGPSYVFRAEQDEISILRQSSDDSGEEPQRGDLRVQLLLVPTCSYTVSVRASLGGAFRRVLVLYGAQIPSFIVCHVMLALAMQLKSVGDSRYCPSILTSVLALTPMLAVPFVKLTAMVLKKLDVYNDQQMMIESGIDLGLLPIFLFFSCLPLTLFLSGGVWLTVLAAGNTLNSAAVRLFGATVGTGEVVAELALTGVAKVPAVVAVALIALAFGSCGTLALALAAIFYLMQLFDMYKVHVSKVIAKLIPRLQDETVPDPPAPAPPFGRRNDANTAATDETNTSDDTAAAANAGSESASSSTASSAATTTEPKPPVIPQSSETMSLHLHLSMFMLVVVSTVLQVPSLITWALRAKQGSFTVLAVDPSLIPCVATLAALAVVWQCSPHHDRQHYKMLGQIVHFLSVLTLLFSSISTYRAPYFVAASISVVALHQVFAPRLHVEA